MVSSYLLAREVSAGHDLEEGEDDMDDEDLRCEEEAVKTNSFGAKTVKEEVEQIQKLTISDVPINQNEQITE